MIAAINPNILVKIVFAVIETVVLHRLQYAPHKKPEIKHSKAYDDDPLENRESLELKRENNSMSENTTTVIPMTENPVFRVPRTVVRAGNDEKSHAI